MRNYIYILTFMISMKSFSQSKKEVVYLIFDKNNTEKCKINVEQTYENKKVKSFVKKYEKEKKNDKIIFNICDEKFIFNYENSALKLSIGVFSLLFCSILIFSLDFF